jgi:hypothetical protein
VALLAGLAGEHRFTEQEWDSMDWWHPIKERHYLREGVDPDPILKRMLSDERHPDGNGDLLRQIPRKRREEFLCGILDGLAEN